MNFDDWVNETPEERNHRIRQLHAERRQIDEFGRVTSKKDLPKKRHRPHRIVVGGTMRQAQNRRDELIREMQLDSKDWVMLSTTSGDLRKLDGIRIDDGDLVDFVGTWADGNGASALLDKLASRGWDGTMISAQLREHYERQHRVNAAIAAGIAREIHQASRGNP